MFLIASCFVRVVAQTLRVYAHVIQHTNMGTTGLCRMVKFLLAEDSLCFDLFLVCCIYSKH